MEKISQVLEDAKLHAGVTVTEEQANQIEQLLSQLKEAVGEAKTAAAAHPASTSGGTRAGPGSH